MITQKFYDVNHMNVPKARELLKADTVFTGCGGLKVKAYMNKIVAIGGESVIYEAEAQNRERSRYALKYYDRFDAGYKENFNETMKFILAKKAADLYLTPCDYGFTSAGNAFEIQPLIDSSSSLEDKRLSYKEIRSNFLPQILEAISQMHKNGFLHRDIKPANILYLDGRYLLSDFGTAIHSSNAADEAANAFTRTIQLRQSVGYSPNEILSGACTAKTDIYSLGVTIASLYLGRHPYKNLLENDPAKFYVSVFQNGFPMGCRNGEEALQALVNAMTRIDPAARASIREIEQWMRDENYMFSSAASPTTQSTYKGGVTEKLTEMIENWSREKLLRELRLNSSEPIKALKGLGYGDSAAKVCRLAMTDQEAAIVYFFRILESAAEENESRRHIIKLYMDSFARDIDLIYVVNHIDYYVFDVLTQKLLTELKAVNLNEAASIEEVNGAILKLLPVYQEFKTAFGNNPFKVSLGIDAGFGEISCNKREGYFDEFKGKMYPIGLIEKLKKLEA